MKNNMNGKKYWRSLDEINQTPEFEQFLKNEFSEGTFDVPNGMSRRKFLSIMGASIALAGLASCRRPVEKIIPYAIAPENIVPGTPKYYSTNIPFGSESYGVIVENHEGRPTKLEGNPNHPSTLGKSNAWLQASILDMYDPDRAQSVLHNGYESKLENFATEWKSLDKDFKPSQGDGLAVFSETLNSPTYLRLKQDFLSKYPKAKWVTWDPVSDEMIHDGIRLATGRDYDPVYHYEKAKVVVSLDADFLNTETHSIRHTVDFMQGRRVNDENDSMNRLYVVENSLSVTGGIADHRYRLSHGKIGAFAAALAVELKSMGLSIPGVSELSDYKNHSFNRKWINALANDLIQNRKQSLVVAGRSQSANVHSLVFAINYALKNRGTTVEYFSSDKNNRSDTKDLRSLVVDMKNGDISTLVIFGGNPAYNTPVDLHFNEAVNKVKHTIHISSHVNETSKKSEWSIHKAHPLESWGDTITPDGTKGITQPQIQPLFGGISFIELLSSLIVADETISSGYDLTQETWKTIFGSDFTSNWRTVLHDGVYKNQLTKPANPFLSNTAMSKVFKQNSIVSSEGYEIVFKTSSSLFDGRFSNNGWLQETPDPITKLSWDNAALLSHSTAKELGVNNRDIISLKKNGYSVELPVWIMPGHADQSISVELGYGRTSSGRVGNGVGENTYALRELNALWRSDNVKISKTSKTTVLACTQDHHGLDTEKLAADAIQKRLPAIVRESTLEDYKENPNFVNEHDSAIPLVSMWDEVNYDSGPQWGMTIDLNVCTGCNACSVSCQGENNIPIVGKDQVEKGREMSWIRLDRYYSGDMDNPDMVIQPVNCQHCEMAPCEQVCPVSATTHSEDGLNSMTYNRCVGTRYCANNCPYKVRRFNFHNFTKDLPEIVQMVQNPDVTVRFRGVMEKCTFCVQRITQAKITANNEGRSIQDGEVSTACQQSCPSDAIIFGDITDPDSQISALRKQNRMYALLGEINTQPRVTYLAKLRNPNPDLKPGELS